MRTIPKGKCLSFVMVSKKGEGWTAPPLFIFHAAVNMLEGYIMESRPYLRSVLHKASEWRGTGLISLKSTNMEYVEEWRNMIVQLDFHGFKLDMFPKDSLLVGTDLTLMLKSKF